MFMMERLRKRVQQCCGRGTGPETRTPPVTHFERDRTVSEKYLISLATYGVWQKQFVVTDDKRVEEEVMVPVVVKDQMVDILRAPGVLQNGMEICDAVCLARTIKDIDGTDLVVDKKDLQLIQRIMNVLIARPHNPAMNQVSLSGPVWEELILRVFKPQKVE